MKRKREFFNDPVLCSQKCVLETKAFYACRFVLVKHFEFFDACLCRSVWPKVGAAEALHLPIKNTPTNLQGFLALMRWIHDDRPIPTSHIGSVLMTADLLNMYSESLSKLVQEITLVAVEKPHEVMPQIIFHHKRFFPDIASWIEPCLGLMVLKEDQIGYYMRLLKEFVEILGPQKAAMVCYDLHSIVVDGLFENPDCAKMYVELFGPQLINWEINLKTVSLFYCWNYLLSNRICLSLLKVLTARQFEMLCLEGLSRNIDEDKILIPMWETICMKMQKNEDPALLLKLWLNVYFFLSVHFNNFGFADKALNAGADINFALCCRTKVDKSPRKLISTLGFCCMKGNSEAVEYLLKHNPSLTGEPGSQPVFQAILGGAEDCFTMLLNACDPTSLLCLNSSGRTVLLEAISAYDMDGFPLELVQALVEKIPFLLNLPDPEDNFTPLMQAIVLDHRELVKELLKAGADVDNCRSTNGETARELASDDPEMLYVLNCEYLPVVRSV